MAPAKVLLIVAATLAALAAGGGLFIESGYYDIGADDHHTSLTLSIIEQLRDRSIDVRARQIDVTVSSTTPRESRPVRGNTRRSAPAVTWRPASPSPPFAPGCIRIRRTLRRRRCSRHSARSGSSSTE